MAKDYYKILGVEKGASQDEIKKAFRKKAHEFHPDKSSGDEAKFKEANEAYQVLGDEKKKSQYDQFGSNFENMGGFGGASGFNWSDFQGGAQGFDMGDLGDIFGDFFGGSRRNAGKKRYQGEDIQVDLQISFKEAIFGVEKNIELYKNIKCESCNGEGGDLSAKKVKCETCNGKGQVASVRQTILGNIQTVNTCSACQGEGEFYEKKCNACNGLGLKKEKVVVNVAIPAGVQNKMTLRVSGQGEAGKNNGPYGDLYVVLRVNNDSEFIRDEDDIKSEVLVPFTSMVFGDKIKINTIEGDITLKIPEGTKSGHTFILKGKGSPRFQRSGRGDHLVKVRVEVPSKLSKEQKNKLKEIRELGV